MARTDSLATPQDVAAYLKIPVKTLAEWRSKGTGPAFHKVGVHVRYRWADVDLWLCQKQSVPA